jgi:hypothetical protein
MQSLRRRGQETRGRGPGVQRPGVQRHRLRSFISNEKPSSNSAESENVYETNQSADVLPTREQQNTKTSLNPTVRNNDFGNFQNYTTAPHGTPSQSFPAQRSKNNNGESESSNNPRERPNYSHNENIRGLRRVVKGKKKLVKESKPANTSSNSGRETSNSENSVTFIEPIFSGSRSRNNNEQSESSSSLRSVGSSASTIVRNPVASQIKFAPSSGSTNSESKQIPPLTMRSNESVEEVESENGLEIGRNSLSNSFGRKNSRRNSLKSNNNTNFHVNKIDEYTSKLLGGFQMANELFNGKNYKELLRDSKKFNSIIKNLKICSSAAAGQTIMITELINSL